MPVSEMEESPISVSVSVPVSVSVSIPVLITIAGSGITTRALRVVPRAAEPASDFGAGLAALTDSSSRCSYIDAAF